MKFLCSILVSLVSLVPLAYAEQTFDLDRITVTPFRYEEDLDKSTSAVTVVSREDIKRSNANRVIDVLKSVAGVRVSDLMGNGTQASVDIAGFGELAALNVLVLVDGRRANNVDTSGVDWNQIPLAQVERIEVIQGGSSGVLYGDNASSGVINIITKNGSGKTKGNVEFEGGSYGLNKQELSLEGAIRQKFSYWLNATRASSNGFRRNSFNKDNNFASKLSYDATDVLKIRFSSGFKESTYGMPGAVYQNNIDQQGRRVTRYPGDHTNGKDYYFVAGFDTDFSEKGKVSGDFSYRRNEVNSYFLGSHLDTRKNQITTYGITPKYTLTHSILDKENKLITGIDFYRTFFNSDNFNPVNEHNLKNLTRIHKTSLAGYFQDELSLLESLVWTNGYRYEMARYTFNYHDLTSWSPDVDSKTRPGMHLYDTGLVYTYSEGSNAFVNVGRSFRFPEVDEFTYQDSNFQQQLNTSLKTQSSINYQLGLRQKFSERLKSSVMLYRQDVHNELYFNAAGGPYGYGQNENYSKTVHQGFEVSPEAKLYEWMTLWGNYTFTNAYFNKGIYNKNNIPLVPQHSANVGLRFKLPKNITFNTIGNYVGKRYFLNDQANNYSQLNDYFTVDTNISWAYKDLTVTFGVNNLLDKHYSQYAGVRLTDSFPVGYYVGDKFYYPSPGRNFDLKVGYKF
ncbi:MAG: TonB-dependent receptor [Candidatus Omnitrophota bacterium]